MDELRELWYTLWHALGQAPGVSHVEKLGKRAIVFRVGGVQHSVYVYPDGGGMALFRTGNKVATCASVADVIENIKPVEA